MSCDDGGRLCLPVLPHLSSSGAPIPGYILPASGCTLPVLPKEPTCQDQSPCDLSYPGPISCESVFPLGEASLSIGDQEMVHWGFFNLLRKFCVFVGLTLLFFKWLRFFSELRCPNYQLTAGTDMRLVSSCLYIKVHKSFNF